MGFIRNRWRSFVGENIGGFYVYDLSSQVRANRDGSPNYDVRCRKCGHYTIMSQTQVANAERGVITLCRNQTCSASRVQHDIETLANIREQERREKERNQREQALRQAESAKQAAKERAEQEEKTRWGRFASSLFESGVTINSPEWVTFERWCGWSPEFRAKLLEEHVGIR